MSRVSRATRHNTVISELILSRQSTAVLLTPTFTTTKGHIQYTTTQNISPKINRAELVHENHTEHIQKPKPKSRPTGPC